MTRGELIDSMIDQGWDVAFIYNGKKCGLSSEVYNGVFSFQAWCGSGIKEYGAMNIENVINDPFFDGKSINELMNMIEMDFF